MNETNKTEEAIEETEKSDEFTKKQLSLLVLVVFGILPLFLGTITINLPFIYNAILDLIDFLEAIVNNLSYYINALLENCIIFLHWLIDNENLLLRTIGYWLTGIIEITIFLLICLMFLVLSYME